MIEVWYACRARSVYSRVERFFLGLRGACLLVRDLEARSHGKESDCIVASDG